MMKGSILRLAGVPIFEFPPDWNHFQTALLEQATFQEWPELRAFARQLTDLEKQDNAEGLPPDEPVPNVVLVEQIDDRSVSRLYRYSQGFFEGGGAHA